MCTKKGGNMDINVGLSYLLPFYLLYHLESSFAEKEKLQG